jgi:hypothetical protein
MLTPSGRINAPAPLLFPVLRAQIQSVRRVGKFPPILMDTSSQSRFRPPVLPIVQNCDNSRIVGKPYLEITSRLPVIRPAIKRRSMLAVQAGVRPRRTQDISNC